MTQTYNYANGPAGSLPAALINNLSDAIIIVDWKGIVVYMNEVAALLFEMKAGEAASRELSRLLHAEDLAIISSLLSRIAHAEDTQRFEYVRMGAAGASSSIQLNAFAVSSRAGVVVERAVVARDVSSIKKLEHELAGSELRFRTIIDAVPQLIWQNDGDGHAFYFNQRWYEYSGLSYAESEGPGWPVMVHPLDNNAVENWHASLAAGTLFVSEARLRRADGEYEWHLLRNVPLKDAGGIILGWFGTATNIHEQKKAELRLKATSKRLHATLEAAIDFAIITLDKDGYIVDWNSGAENMFGYDRSEAIGQFTDIFFTPEDRYGGIPLEEIRRAETTGHSLDERWHLRKDGSRFFMSGVMTRIMESSITGYVKVARNITDRKLTEEALFLSEQRQSIAIQSTQMGEWDWDIPADRVKWNEHASRLLGMTTGAGSSHNPSFFTCIHPEDLPAVRQALDITLKGSLILQSEYRIIRADNAETAWVSMYGRVITHRDEQPVRMIGVIYDITARKMLEKQKDDFISIASHELKTPVSSIRGYSQLVLQTLNERGDTENAQLLIKMNSQVERLTRLLYALLDSTSMLEGRLRLIPEPFDVNQLIQQEIEDLQLIYPRHRLTWRPGKIAIVHADKGRIRQVLTNLISNAAKYSSEATEIVIATEDLMDGVLVKVTDQGIGISVEDQARIFERYFRGGEHEWNKHSFGLGLYISLEIIKQHHGMMGVESVRGEGSTFYFKLPYT
jgi:PAS domain S-box-containing protein